MQLEEIFGVALAAVSIAVAIYYGRVPIRQARERQSIEEFTRTRRLLKDNAYAVKEIANTYHRLLIPDTELPILRGPTGYSTSRSRLTNSS